MLHDDLKKLNRYPFHMPGHKRNHVFDIAGSDIDITEIQGFDNLHAPCGTIMHIEKRLSALYHSKHSFMLVNGSTVGILAAIFAVTHRGNKIIIARNCHKSVYNACFLRELNIIYIEPEYNRENGFYTRLSQSAIDKAVKNNPDAAAVVITSPTYEGYISNIKTDIPLIIDAAHGAHFGFGGFPEYPKADIVISSLHKTLPSLTQTAVANIYNETFIKKVQNYLDIFETSSPSYVLMNSVSKCAHFLENSENNFKEYEKNLDEFYKIKLNNLKLIHTDDKGKLIVSSANCNISGTELADILRNDYSMECEMASLNYIILMTSVADNKSAFAALAEALKQTDEKLSKCKKESIAKPAVPKGICRICEAEKTAAVRLIDAAGKISGEYIYAYPPDIPLIAPGEIISEEIIAIIQKMIESKINIISDSDLLPTYILTKAD